MTHSPSMQITSYFFLQQSRKILHALIESEKPPTSENTDGLDLALEYLPNQNLKNGQEPTKIQSKCQSNFINNINQVFWPNRMVFHVLFTVPPTIHHYYQIRKWLTNI